MTRAPHLTFLHRLAATLCAAAGLLLFTACQGDKEPEAAAHPAASAPAQPAQPAPSGGVTMSSGRSAEPTPEEIARAKLDPRRRPKDRTPLYFHEGSFSAAATAGVIRVEGSNGSVSVAGADRLDVAIKFELGATTTERMSGARVVAEPQADGSLRIHAEWPDKRLAPEVVSYVIETPRMGGGVTVVTTGGEVTLRDAPGDANVTTTVGGVTVTGQGGGVRVKAENARVAIERPGGETRVVNKNAGIDVLDTAFAVHAETTNGGIRVRLSLNPRGGVFATTSLGVIALEVPEGFGGQIVANTDPARLEVDPKLPARMSRDTVTGAPVVSIGEAGAATPSALTAKSGGIKISRRAGN